MQRVLIIKTGYAETFRPDLTYASVSYGDILRSTPILHLFKRDEVHWLTDIKAVPLLYGIKRLTSIHLVNTLDVLGLKTYSWDVIVNLESSRGSCQLVNDLIGPCTKLIGYYLNGERISMTSSYYGNNWSEKLFSLFGKKWNGESYFIPHRSIRSIKNRIFLNRSIGPKLPEKRWEGWDNLGVLLEKEGFSTASQQSSIIEEFIDEIQTSCYVISTDSLGLHIALALKKPVLGLFGPTRASEVADFKNYIQRDLALVTPEEVFKKFKRHYEKI